MAKAKRKSIYSCQNCGAQRSRWEGRCSDCGAWNSYVEEVTSAATAPGARGWVGSQPLGSVASGVRTATHYLDQEITEAQFQRYATGFGELDRVLGGGLVRGSLVLLGGAPGIGKSTILLQMAGGLAHTDTSVLYVSAEESAGQTAHRAHRLGVRSSKVGVLCESDLVQILTEVDRLKPSVVIVDSIQTMFLPELEAAPGSVSQVRECASRWMQLAKNQSISVVLVGHVTKDGSIAGPKVLEHMVDTVLSFEGDSSHSYRLLRALKNRFGPTNELGVFRMVGSGLQEVANPSELFLEERSANRQGAVVFASMEGSRPLLCEIQALTATSYLPSPRRTALGLDPNRLHMITAVLDRHLNCGLSHSDIFINVAGGLRLQEPSADLAVAAAILSSQGGFEVDAKTVLVGELGLSGEVRAVATPELRVREALRLGFSRFLVPEANRRHFSDLSTKEKSSLHFVRSISELLPLLGGSLRKRKASARGNSNYANSSSIKSPNAQNSHQGQEDSWDLES